MTIVESSSDIRLRNCSTSAEALELLDQLTFLQQCSNGMRQARFFHQRMMWEEHACQLEHEQLFVNEYTMSYDTHSKLCDILRPALLRKEFRSQSDVPISVEHIIAAGLRTLQGGRIKDARHIIGSSRAAAYAAFDDFIDAVNVVPELEIKAPQNDSEWRAVNEGFAQRSTHRTMGGCCGALDGFFQRCNKPTKNEVTNIVSYYSGHYESYGVNVQALVKADLQFMYFGVISPGSTNDVNSYNMADGLKELTENLPLGLYFVGDAAYTLTEKLLIPFYGSQRFSSVYHDAFNYYLSQMRIRVEMAFGRLVNKFRILSGKINGSLHRVARILMACARLHNFIVQRDGPCDAATIELSTQEEQSFLQIRPNPDAPLGMSYLPTVPDNDYVFDIIQGVSHTRAEIVEWLESECIRRPHHNLVRRDREDLEQEWVGSQNTNHNSYSIEREFINPN